MATISDVSSAHHVIAPGRTSSQRQSCDRCHKKKLRCTREVQAGGGGSCDRCRSKRAQCVYSVALPKGRPSLHRTLIKDCAASTTDTTATATTPNTSVNPAFTHGPTFSSTGCTSEAMCYAAIPSDTCSWPSSWLDSMPVDTTQHLLGWESLNTDQTCADGILATSNAFEYEGSGHDISDAFVLQQPPSPPDSTRQSVYAIHERLNNSDISAEHDNKSPRCDGNIGVVIAQLSELSVHLSSLRVTGHDLLQAANPASSQTLSTQPLPLINSATFEMIGAWLTDGTPNIRLTSKPQGCSNILYDLFSASNRFVEIIRQLRADSIVQHLLLACDSLLLEVYLNILGSLEHQVCRNESSNHASLEKVRLVLVVQLCAYLIESQHQAVERCLSPTSTPRHYSSGATSFQTDSERGDYLNSIQHRIRKKLTMLRQVLGCS